MSSPETSQTQLNQTQNLDIEVKYLDEETMKNLVKNILREQDKFQREANLILVLKREGRRSGCGYVYLYKNDYEVLEGEVIEVTLDYGEYDCNWFEDVAIIPKTVPVIIVERYHNDEPEVSDYINVHVFGSDGWKGIRVFVPK